MSINHDCCSIECIFSKHVGHNRYKYDTRNDIMIFASEILCESIMNNLDIKYSLQFLINMFNFSYLEIEHILNRNILYLPDYSILDIAMKNWCANIYDSINFSSNIHLTFNNVNRFNDVKFLIEHGAKILFQLNSDKHQIYHVLPPDFIKIKKYVTAKLIYSEKPELLKLFREYRKHISHEKKSVAKYNKDLRILKYLKNKSPDEISIQKQNKQQRRSVWTCPICLDNSHKSKIVLKECKHKFHSDCFLKYVISSDDKKKCPYCRHSLDSNI